MSDILEFVKSTKVYLDNLTNYKKVDSISEKYSNRDMLYTVIAELAGYISADCDEEVDAIHFVYCHVKKYLRNLEEVIRSTQEFDPVALASLSAYTIAVLSGDYFLTTDHDVQESLLHATRTLENVDYLLKKANMYTQASQWTTQQYMRAVVSTFIPFLKVTNFIDDLGECLEVHLPQIVQEV